MSSSTKRRDNDLSVPQIAAMLAEQAEAVCDHYLDNGLLVSGCYRTDSIHGGPGDHLSVILSGDKAGRWRDFREDIGGDLIDLIRHAKGLELGEAVVEAKRYLGILDGERRSPANKPAPAPAPRVKGLTAKERQKLGLAREIWKAAGPIAGTAAERYLRRRRAIAVPLPDVLRFAPALDVYHNGVKIDRRPAMVAAFSIGQQLRGVHMTFFDSAAAEVPDKADLGADPRTGKKINPRHVLGPVRGAGIWLTPIGAKLRPAEGIETALSVLQLCPGVATVAAGSSSYFSGLEVPAVVEDFVIVADGTSKAVTRPDGSRYVPAEQATRRAIVEQARRRRDTGRPFKRCGVYWPAEGDINDLLMRAVENGEDPPQLEGLA